MAVYSLSSLAIAEQIAYKHDVIDSFREIYEMRRQYDNVFESVEYTMSYLGLYDTWYNEWVKTA